MDGAICGDWFPWALEEGVAVGQILEATRQ